MHVCVFENELLTILVKTWLKNFTYRLLILQMNDLEMFYILSAYYYKDGSDSKDLFFIYKVIYKTP